MKEEKTHLACCASEARVHHLGQDNDGMRGISSWRDGSERGRPVCLDD